MSGGNLMSTVVMFFRITFFALLFALNTNVVAAAYGWREQPPIPTQKEDKDKTQDMVKIIVTLALDALRYDPVWRDEDVFTVAGSSKQIKRWTAVYVIGKEKYTLIASSDGHFDIFFRDKDDKRINRKCSIHVTWNDELESAMCHYKPNKLYVSDGGVSVTRHERYWQRERERVVKTLIAYQKKKLLARSNFTKTSKKGPSKKKVTKETKPKIVERL